MAEQRVLVIGHSFVSRLTDYLRRSNNWPTRLDGCTVQLAGFRGATLHRLTSNLDNRLDHFRVIYVEIGSNDLCEPCSVDGFVSRLILFAHFLIRRGVSQVVIGEVVFRTERCRYRMGVSLRHYNMAVREANSRLSELCRGNRQLTFHRHRRLYNPNFICADGVHLTDDAMRIYWRSVRGALLHALRQP